MVALDDVLITGAFAGLSAVKNSFGGPGWIGDGAAAPYWKNFTRFISGPMILKLNVGGLK